MANERRDAWGRPCRQLTPAEVEQWDARTLGFIDGLLSWCDFDICTDVLTDEQAVKIIRAADRLSGDGYVALVNDDPGTLLLISEARAQMEFKDAQEQFRSPELLERIRLRAEQSRQMANELRRRRGMKSLEAKIQDEQCRKAAQIEEDQRWLLLHTNPDPITQYVEALKQPSSVLFRDCLEAAVMTAAKKVLPEEMPA
jgi:hypothetical protein